MAHPDHISVDELAKMGPDALDRLLGEAILQEGMFSKPQNDAEILAEGQGFFASMLPDLRQRLCGNARVAAVFAAETKDRNTLILAVAEALSGVQWPLVLSARLIYYGYERLCPKPAS